MTSLADVEKAINALGHGTVEYHEAMAMYGITIARSQWRLAEAAGRGRARRPPTRDHKGNERGQMTGYASEIVLGRKYRHKSLEIEGFAEAVTFYKNACERVLLLYTHKGEMKDIIADAVELVDVESKQPVLRADEAKPGGPERGMAARPTAERR